MYDIENSVRVTIVQGGPVFMDSEAAATSSSIFEAGEKGTNLHLFPKVFILVYPRGLSSEKKVRTRSQSGRKDWFRYWNNSVSSETIDFDAVGEYVHPDVFQLTSSEKNRS